jgi:16S rRNA (cytidine1402-2'-O)-methyltransferase
MNKLKSHMETNKLNIVGTSLGNIEDISIRALRYIFESDIVLAEDTRVFTKMKSILLERQRETLIALGLQTSKHQDIRSYRDQNHDKVIRQIIEELKSSDKVVSLFSDSGMPGISDPGWLLIDDTLKNGIGVDVIPGPTAVINALLLSGFSTDRFSFLGFLPRKAGKAIKIINKYLDSENTVIIYESPFRVLKTLEMIQEKFEWEADEKFMVSASFEMTKKFQNTLRGEITEVIETLKKSEIKGECVICLRLMKS